MTNREAIEILGELKKCYLGGIVDAIDMAIEAVKAQELVVRGKDCKHRTIDNRGRDDDLTGFAIEFPDSCCPCKCEDGWYNWYPNDDWYCANGERMESE